jgi:hypothetical protein
MSDSQRRIHNCWNCGSVEALIMSSNPELFVVIGDVHAKVALALPALARIEQEQGRKIAQVFSVGDFGLFLSERDWDFFTGPARHKHPDWSPEIRKAWTRWQWPLAVIGGNHEPWHRLRVFDPGHFGDKLSYTNGGVLPHNLSGLMVVGLSGIQRPSKKVCSAEPAWQETLAQCQFGKISRRELTFYFLEAAVERMFTADEVSGVVVLAKLKELKHRIVELFLYARETGRNQWN